VIPGERGILGQIDHFQTTLLFEMFGANPLQIGDRSQGPWRLAGDIQSKLNQTNWTWLFF
jgi:hypothetical protein